MFVISFLIDASGVILCFLLYASCILRPPVSLRLSHFHRACNCISVKYDYAVYISCWPSLLSESVIGWNAKTLPVGVQYGNKRHLPADQVLLLNKFTHDKQSRFSQSRGLSIFDSVQAYQYQNEIPRPVSLIPNNILLHPRPFFSSGSLLISFLLFQPSS